MISTGSTIGSMSPDMAAAEANYASHVQAVFDSLYLQGAVQQYGVESDEVQAFLSTRPDIKLTFGVLASASFWGLTAWGFMA